MKKPDSDLLYSAHPWAPPLRGRRRSAPTFTKSSGTDFEHPAQQDGLKGEAQGCAE
jgi:hypothetical protein